MRTRNLLVVSVGIAAAGLGGCGRAGAPGERVIRVWCHQGQAAENEAMRAMAGTFNAAHAGDGWQAELTFFPDFEYAEKIAIAAAAGDLPDALDLDGPQLARLVDARLLVPLEPWISRADRDDFLPTILAQGTVGGHLYALGAFESAAVLYYDRAMLQSAGVPPPPDEVGWTWKEFLAACQRLQAAGIEPVALHMNESADEWFTYAFSPVIWSGGGALIAPDGRSVRGVLASDANLRSLQAWQELFRRRYAAADPVDPDPFGAGRVAMDWSGHWMARSHLARKGDRLGVMVLPRMGPAPVAPCGSWCWAVTARAHDPHLAAAWVRWATDARHGVEPMVRANGAIPARRSAFAAFPEYEATPYRLFRWQLEHIARPRPRTPFYATLTREFAAALRDIAHGAAVASRLKAAEDEVQKAIDRRLGMAGLKGDDEGIVPDGAKIGRSAGPACRTVASGEGWAARPPANGSLEGLAPSGPAPGAPS